MTSTHIWKPFRTESHTSPTHLSHFSVIDHLKYSALKLEWMQSDRAYSVMLVLYLWTTSYTVHTVSSSIEYVWVILFLGNFCWHQCRIHWDSKTKRWLPLHYRKRMRNFHSYQVLRRDTRKYRRNELYHNSTQKAN